MSALLKSFSQFDAKQNCRVVVLYDSVDTRAKAMQFCDHLLLQFGEELDIEFDWWRTDFLAEIQLAELSAANAVTADIFIVCTNPAKQLPPPVKTWFDSWADKHAGHLGALVDLSAMPTGQPGCAQPFLREISKAASLDFLEPIQDASHPYWASYQASENRVPHRDEPPAPEHYGLNE